MKKTNNTIFQIFACSLGTRLILCSFNLCAVFFAGCSGGGSQENESEKAPLVIAYSDWPGWIAWQIGIEKGFFEEAGVEVKFEWFEYAPSMDAFAANKVDAVCMTNGDALVTGASGKKGIAIVINDYSNGNDMLVAKPGIEDVKSLKGKKIGYEEGYVPHHLLMEALKQNEMSEEDIEGVNVATDQTPQVLKSGQVDAIVAWQPNAGQALKQLPGSKAIFTSADAPGLIYDLLFVSPESLSERKEDWQKVVNVWFRIHDFIKDEKNMEETLKILSARAGVTPEEYKPFLSGTYLLGLEGNKKHFQQGNGLDSVYGSSKYVDAFNVKFKVYKDPQEVDSYFDPSFVESVK